ncbi:MAG: sigma-70 family RNA polymerase sigma factor [Planctomycetota bacterium]
MDTGVLETYRQQPDLAALQRLLQQAQQWCFHTAFPVLRQREDAEDVTQELLLRLIDDLPTIRDTDHLRRWVRRVGLNKAIDVRRMRHRRLQREKQEAKPVAVVNSDHLREDDLLAIHSCIAELDDDAQDLVCGYFFAKEPLRVLAEQRNCSTNAIWKRLEKAKEQLGKNLDRAGYSALIPGVIPYLGSIQPPSPGPLPPAVVARAQQVATSAVATTAVTMGGLMVAGKKSWLLLSLVALLGVGLGTGLGTYLAGERDTTTVADRGPVDDTPETDADEMRTRLAALTAENAELKQRLQSPRSATPSEAPATGAATAGTPAPDLRARLEALGKWLDREIQGFETADRSNRADIEQYQKNFEQRLAETTDGLRALILNDAATFFDFVRSTQQHEAFYHLVFDLAVGKVIRPSGGWSMRVHDYDTLPPAFTEGLYDLLADTNPVLRQVSVQLLGNLSNLPDSRVEALRDLVQDSNRRVAGSALQALNNSTPTQLPLDPELQEEVLQIIDNDNDSMLISAAIYALQRTSDPVAETRLLELLERNQLPDQEGTILGVLTTKISSTNPDNHRRYAQALMGSLRPSATPWAFDQAISLALRLPSEHHPATLDHAHRNAPDNVRADAIATILTQSGKTSAQLQLAYTAAVHPERVQQTSTTSAESTAVIETPAPTTAGN